MNDNQIKKSEIDIEITLFDILGFFKKYTLILAFTGVMCGIIGIAYSFLLKKKYTAQTVLLPELGAGRGESFFSMALGSGSNDPSGKLVPDLYPNILSTISFGQHLLSVPITDQANTTYPSLEQYLKRDTSQSIFSRFFSSKKPKSTAVYPGSLLKNKDIISISLQQEALINTAKGLIMASVDKTDKLITIECEMDDPVAAAILVDASQNYLISYVSDYTVSKSTQQVDFLEKRVDEAQKRQRNTEYALQQYRDANRNTFLNVARIQEQRLQAEYVLAQSVYSDLVVKLEQAKIREKEEKPIFKVLNPVKVPLIKSSPNRILIGIIFSIFGVFAMLCYIIFFKEKIHHKLI